MKFILILAGVVLSWFSTQADVTTNEWLHLTNQFLRVGVKTTSGAGLAWISDATGKTNWLNHFDKGRLIQQSYYGDKDGSTWNGQEWRWNPVQGGEWKGTPSQLLETKASATELYARLHPRNWGGGELLTNVVMEEKISLDGQVARVHFKMTYNGTNTHELRHQEVPAVFVEPDLATLVHFDGEHPWTGAPVTRSSPGWPNESRRITEHWAAYVNTNDFGLGVMVPVADELTCYRYAAGHTSAEGACSYFAPLVKFAITPGFVFEYDVFLTLGSSTEIRERFKTIANPANKKN